MPLALCMTAHPVCCPRIYRLVQQFLRETFSILEKKEHFFRRMRVHILQCDSMIQDYRLIESEEDWKEYQKHLKITGFGNTDFRPVFDWIEQKKVCSCCVFSLLAKYSIHFYL